MHDGSRKTLEQVVEWYAKGGHRNPYLSEKMKKLELSEQDKKDLVEYLKALTGPFPAARWRGCRRSTRGAQEGWMTGLEPATPRSTIWCSTRLSYIHRVANG
jgi:hypothetical protein